MSKVFTSPIVDSRGNKIQHLVVNRYEAAYQNPSRSWISGWLNDVDKDIDYLSRSEISRKARYLQKNSPVTRGITQWLTTYIVGTGIMPIPASENERWNDVARNVFFDWATYADLQTNFSWWELQNIICEAVITDGDIAEFLTRDKSGRPRVQLIEGHKITGGESRENPNLHDGVMTDSMGRPVKYYVSTIDGKTKSVDAEGFVLHYLPHRAGQHRGISMWHAAINTIQDLEEICALEKQAVKIHSSQEGVVELSGGLDIEDLFNDSNYSTDGISAVESSAKKKYYREVLGTETKVLDPGDKYTHLVSNRPSPAWQGFVDHLLDSIALSLGVPPSVLFNQKKGGADTRRDLAAADRAFKRVQYAFAGQFQRVYEYVIYEEHVRGNIKRLPADWRRVSWQFPQSITVDNGRDSKADIENLKMGVDTFKSIYGRYGLDWKEEIEQVAKEQQFIKELAEKYGLRPEDIQLKAAKQLEDQQNAQQTQVSV